MKMRLYIAFLGMVLVSAVQSSHAQNMAINADGSAPDPSAMLDVKSNSQGFLLPRMTEANKNAITSPANGLMVFQSDGESGLYVYDGGTTSWVHVLDSIDVSTLEQGIADVLAIDSNAQGRGIYDVGKLGIGTNSLGTNDFYLEGIGYVNMPTNNSFFTIDNYGGGLSVRNTNNNHYIRLRPNTGGPLYQSRIQFNNNGNSLDLIIDDAPASSVIQASTDLTLYAGGTTGTIHLDATNGNMGIGTVTPPGNRILQAFSTSTSSLGSFVTTASGSSLNDGFNFGYVDALGGVVMLSENQPLQWGTNGNYRMWLDPAGNLGVGISNPQTVLALQGNGGINAVGITQNEVAGTSAMEFTTADGVGAQATRMVLRGGNNNPNTTFLAGASGSEVDLMTLVGSNGRLGVGTSTPNSLLSLESTTGDLTSGINFKNGANDWYIYQDNTSGLVFRDDINDRITVLANGNVGIGVSAPSEILHINGPGRSTSALWLTTSDRRAKQNIESIDNALSLIRQFRPVTFEWKPEFESDKVGLPKYNYGFISQEVEKVLPEMVKTTTEVIGNDTITDFKILDKDPLIALLVKAIQEQQMQIAELTQRFDLQEEELKYLRKAVHSQQSNLEASDRSTLTSTHE